MILIPQESAERQQLVQSIGGTPTTPSEPSTPSPVRATTISYQPTPRVGV